MYDNAFTTLPVGIFDDVPATPVLDSGVREREQLIVNAGTQQTVTGREEVTLQGSASNYRTTYTPSYSWTQVGTPTVTLNDATVTMPTFTAPDVSTDTTLTFSLTATATKGNRRVSSSPDMVTIIISPAPNPPVLNPEADDGSATEAVFRGGASSDGGDNYFKDGAFSAGEALDIVFVITPRASDVDEQVSVVIAARMSSAPEAIWLLTESGLLPYDGETLVSFKEGLALEVNINNFITLTPEGPVTLSPAEVGNWELFIGYQLADGTLFYHPEPLRIEVME